MQLPAKSALLGQRLIGIGKVMLHHYRGNLAGRRIYRRKDLLQVPGWMRDWQSSREVFVLNVDYQ